MDEAWQAVVCGQPTAAPGLGVTGGPAGLPSAFDVEGVAVASVASALLAASALAAGMGTAAPVSVDRGHVAAAMRSERSFRIGDTTAPPGFHPLSRYWRAADGWVRTHANAPWHRRALLQALGVDGAPPLGMSTGGAATRGSGASGQDDPGTGTGDDRPDPRAAALATAISGMAAPEVAERVWAAGGVAAPVMTMGGWSRHPQGEAVAGQPLVGHRRLGDAPPRHRPAGMLPAAGVRVLDLTRVIAGPVCTRLLGALGADVLRVDPPGLPDLLLAAPADTLLGKRSTALDLADPGDRATLQSLLLQADVVVQGYRPGSLATRFGLGPEDLAARHPGLVVVSLSAWGGSGPWAGRRGFDSVVQGPTGIGLAESSDAGEPGALPCQLLDHATGYLAAAAALDGLRRQRAGGGTHERWVSLARTAAWLTATSDGSDGADAACGPGHPPPGDDGARWLVPLTDGRDRVVAVAPPGAIGGRPLHWPGFPGRYLAGRPAWLG